METATKTKNATSNKKASTKTATSNATAVAQVKEILMPSAESRIKKLENLQRLADRHSKLTEKRDELDSFNLGVDNLNESLIINNGKESFTVSNSVVVARVKSLIDEELNKLIDKSSDEIVNYSI
jgi:hypothetical protein